MRLSNAVEKELLRMIQSGEYKPGDKLPSERVLMEMFDVGRPSVREALFSIQRQGLIKIRRGDRPLVVEQDPRALFNELNHIAASLLANPVGVREFNETRLIFERSLAREAAENATDEDIAELSMIVEAGDQALDDLELYLELDQKFHRYLCAITGNSLLVSAHETLMDWIMRTRDVVLEPRLHNSYSQLGHERILTAIREGNVELADTAMREHLENAAERAGQRFLKK